MSMGITVPCQDLCVEGTSVSSLDGQDSEVNVFDFTSFRVFKLRLWQQLAFSLPRVECYVHPPEIAQGAADLLMSCIECQRPQFSMERLRTR